MSNVPTNELVRNICSRMRQTCSTPNPYPRQPKLPVKGQSRYPPKKAKQPLGRYSVSKTLYHTILKGKNSEIVFSRTSHDYIHVCKSDQWVQDVMLIQFRKAILYNSQNPEAQIQRSPTHPDYDQMYRKTEAAYQAHPDTNRRIAKSKIGSLVRKDRFTKNFNRTAN